ncbi:MAG: 3-hydroxybutyryl-CoA dehydrogenase [Syntrophomonadaceae bacterium]|nr:3-hydroxyacyl-CoA dehydrogenase NAD-binding domain-containing protein [Syntrophomonadaceae bacterium]NLT21058.1 3-hydroxybutyryl-CoA dehydrogenase [Syntrophomonadaceae bacterium]
MKTVAILGSGIMGAGIAQVAAQAGLSVILRDLQMGIVKDGLVTIEQNLDKMIKRGSLLADEKPKILDRINVTTDLTDVQNSDLVIEAVVENMAVKKQIFAELDHICSDHTILATNTSSLSITEIAASTKRPDRVLGMHFFNPVPQMRLVELVKGIETSDQTIDIARNFTNLIGKDEVVVNRESPGFIVNRILMPFMNEAIFIFGDGLATPEEIDTAMKLGAGMPMGPLELADMIGLDIVHAAILVFYNEFRDPKYRPHTILSTYIRAGYYGRKSGKGFYNYNINNTDIIMGGSNYDS